MFTDKHIRQNRQQEPFTQKPFSDRTAQPACIFMSVAFQLETTDWSSQFGIKQLTAVQKETGLVREGGGSECSMPPSSSPVFNTSRQFYLKW